MCVCVCVCLLVLYSGVNGITRPKPYTLNDPFEIVQLRRLAVGSIFQLSDQLHAFRELGVLMGEWGFGV